MRPWYGGGPHRLEEGREKLRPDYEGIETGWSWLPGDCRGQREKLRPDYEGIETEEVQICTSSTSLRREKLRPDYEGIETGAAAESACSVCHRERYEDPITRGLRLGDTPGPLRKIGPS